MKVLIIGSTGGTGRILVEKLLARGDQVTALARDPAKITMTHPNLRVIKGDVRDANSIDAAVQGQDAVMSAITPDSLKPTDLQQSLFRNLIPAMKKAGARRMVNLSAGGVGDSLPEMPFLYGKILLPLLLKNPFADKLAGETQLFASGLDYVNVRPGRLLNKPARGGVKAAMSGKGLKFEMTRADLADFMIAQLTSQQWLGKSPLIGY